MTEALLIHREADNVFPAIHRCHNQVGHQADDEKYDDGDAPVLDLADNKGELATENAADIESDVGNAADDGEYFANRQEDGWISEHVHGVGPTILSVGAKPYMLSLVAGLFKLLLSWCHDILAVE